MKEKLTVTVLSVFIVSIIAFGIYKCYLEIHFTFEWIDAVIIPISAGLIIFWSTILYLVLVKNFKLSDL